MDIWPGAVFVCVADARLEWSSRACDAISEEAQRLARTGNFRIAVAGTSTSPDAKAAARQAGFDDAIALAIVAKFSGGTAGSTSALSLEATSRADANPGVSVPAYRRVYIQSAVLDPKATMGDAIAACKIMLGTLFEWLQRPVRR